MGIHSHKDLTDHIGKHCEMWCLQLLEKLIQKIRNIWLGNPREN